MDLKSALVLCTVSVFCICEASILRYNFKDYYLGPHAGRFGYSYQPTPVQTTTEQTKEYGKESKVYEADDQSKKFYVSQDAVNWFDARDACKKMGKVLASPTTRSEENEIENYLETNRLNPTNKFDGYWLGSHRTSQYEAWTWESNGQEINGFGWIPGEPNGYEGEDCIEFKMDYSKGWNNYYCVETRRYICQSVPHTHESDKNKIEVLKDFLHEEQLKMYQKEPETLSFGSDDDNDDYYTDFVDDDGDDDLLLNDYEQVEERRRLFQQELERKISGTTEWPQEPSSTPFEPRDVTIEARNNPYDPLVDVKDLESLPGWSYTAYSTESPDSLQESAEPLFEPADIKIEPRGNLIEPVDNSWDLEPSLGNLIDPLDTTNDLETLADGGDTLDSTIGLDSAQEPKDYVDPLLAGIPADLAERIEFPKKGNTLDTTVGLDSVQQPEDYIDPLLTGIPADSAERIEFPKKIEFVQAVTTAAPYSEMIEQHFYSSEDSAQIGNSRPLPVADEYYDEEYDYNVR